jgi:hypothetical protein
MTLLDRPCRTFFTTALLALALVAGARSAAAQVQCYPNAVLPFPHIDLCAFPGHFQDSTLVQPYRCLGSFAGPLTDSIRADARSISLRFKRDRRAEARPDFGGYRIYRVTNQPDTARMVLIRRFSRNLGDERTWNFSVVDSTPTSASYMQFICGGQVVHDSIVTFVDPDSNGSYQKRCKVVDADGRCMTPNDSIMVLVAPPGPHDGFRTWYAVTYEAYNSRENTYEDLFVPDTSDWSACGTPGLANTCPNQNRKETNLTQVYVEPSGGPTANLERVGVVPNPFRGRAPWDPSANNELHFINLPKVATIRVYTLAGDLVTVLNHNDPVRDFERWNLRNADGKEVASGIYMYRVESSTFSHQDRFIVIR